MNVFTDHKYLINESDLKISQKVMRWRLLLQEYGPGVEYIKRSKNALAETLSKLLKQGDIVDYVDVALPFVPVDDHILPVQLEEIEDID